MADEKKNGDLPRRALDLTLGLVLGALVSASFTAVTIGRELAEFRAEVRSELGALRRDVDRIEKRGG